MYFGEVFFAIVRVWLTKETQAVFCANSNSLWRWKWKRKIKTCVMWLSDVDWI